MTTQLPRSPTLRIGSKTPPRAWTLTRDITRSITASAYKVAFPDEKITRVLTGLRKDAGFKLIDKVRNIVGPRVSGRRGIVLQSVTLASGTPIEWSEEIWLFPGAERMLLVLDEELLQRPLDDITRLVMELGSAAIGFAQNHQLA